MADELDDVTPAERAHARAFGRLVDDLVAGAPAPPALDAEERALLDTAAMIQATKETAVLPEARRQALVAAALAARPRARWRRATPWVAFGLAAAAALILALRPAPPPPRAALPDSMRSRPADALVGRIDREQAAAARARIDVIYADRLAGYRQLTLGGGAR